VASFSAVRDGLKANLAAITSLRTYDLLKGAIDPPSGGGAAIVRPGDPLIDFDEMVGGAYLMAVVVTVLVNPSAERTAQDLLDGYLAGSGAASVKAAIETDQTLGGIVSYTKVRTAGNYGTVPVGVLEYEAIDFHVEVMTLP
jgi:hypothetical protein